MVDALHFHPSCTWHWKVSKLEDSAISGLLTVVIITIEKHIVHDYNFIWWYHIHFVLLQIKRKRRKSMLYFRKRETLIFCFCFCNISVSTFIFQNTKSWNLLSCHKICDSYKSRLLLSFSAWGKYVMSVVHHS